MGVLENKAFGQMLGERMRHYGIAQKELGDRVGMAQNTISRYVNGSRVPGEDDKKKIRVALQEIIDEKEEAYSNQELDGNIRCIHRSAREMVTQSEVEADDESLNIVFELNDRRIENIMSRFRQLSAVRQKYFIEYFSLLTSIKIHEIMILDGFMRLKKQDVENGTAYYERMVMNLSQVHLTSDVVFHNVSTAAQVGDAMKMIEAATILAGKRDRSSSEGAKDNGKARRCDEFRNELNHASPAQVDLIYIFFDYILSLDANDWYLVMVLRLLSLRDYGDRWYEFRDNSEPDVYVTEHIGLEMAGLLKMLTELTPDNQDDEDDDQKDNKNLE